VHWGFKGLIDNEIRPMNSHNVSGIIGKAGCVLGTGKPRGCFTQDNMDRAIANLERLKIDKMVVIGGMNSLKRSMRFVERGIKVIGIPSTIQDDIPGTDTSLGVDSALNRIITAIDKVRDSSSSKDRTFLVQVEGRTCGSLALQAAFVSGADYCLVPEHPCEDDMGHLLKKMADATMKGKHHILTVMSTGWKPGFDTLRDFLQEREHEHDLAVRTTVLGYVQRGGAPTAFDRWLGTWMGRTAVEGLIEGKTGLMVGYQEGKFVMVPIEEVMKGKLEFNHEIFRQFRLTRE
jgi:6-phosphofructokinase 1